MKRTVWLLRWIPILGLVLISSACISRILPLVPPPGAGVGPGPDPIDGPVAVIWQGYEWLSDDFRTDKEGSVRVEQGKLVVEADGDDIWRQADGFRYVYFPVTGNFVATVRIEDVPDTHGWTKAGLMLRTEALADSANVSMLGTRDYNLVMQERLMTGGETVRIKRVTSWTTPGYVRIERAGAEIIGSVSVDGTTWQQVGVSEIGMPEQVLIGLAVSSHAPGTLGEAVFSNFELTMTGGTVGWSPGLGPGPSDRYAQWVNGPPNDPHFFPIGVWLQSPHNAPYYKAAGINTYVGLHNGPTKAQLDALREHGMLVIAEQNAVGLQHIDDPIIIAWMHQDEPDNAQPKPGGGYGPPVSPSTIIDLYDQMRENDPTRPVFLNLGQGLVRDDWSGRGSGRPEDYYGYVQGADIVSFDVYPIASIGDADLLWYVARGLDRLRYYSDDTKLLWNIVEAAAIKSNPKRKVTPHELRAQVWMSIVHGSRGIVYFVHQWDPFIEASLLQDPVLLAAVTDINYQIHDLAPVLNSPNVEGLVSVQSSNPSVPVHHIVKVDEDYIYIFAVGMRNAATTATFTVHGKSDFVVEVIDDGRIIPSNGSRFEHSFGPYDVLLARITK